MSHCVSLTLASQVMLSVPLGETGVTGHTSCLAFHYRQVSCCGCVVAECVEGGSESTQIIVFVPVCVCVCVTGDHSLTALAIGKMLGIAGSGQVLTGPEIDRMTDEALGHVAMVCNVFARTSPENKLRIVRVLQVRRVRLGAEARGNACMPPQGSAGCSLCRPVRAWVYCVVGYV